MSAQRLCIKTQRSLSKALPDKGSRIHAVSLLRTIDRRRKNVVMLNPAFRDECDESRNHEAQNLDFLIIDGCGQIQCCNAYFVWGNILNLRTNYCHRRVQRIQKPIYQDTSLSILNQRRSNRREGWPGQSNSRRFHFKSSIFQSFQSTPKKMKNT